MITLRHKIIYAIVFQGSRIFSDVFWSQKSMSTGPWPPKFWKRSNGEKFHKNADVPAKSKSVFIIYVILCVNPTYLLYEIKTW